VRGGGSGYRSAVSSDCRACHSSAALGRLPGHGGDAVAG
jgi:hypothetical protein